MFYFKSVVVVCEQRGAPLVSRIKICGFENPMSFCCFSGFSYHLFHPLRREHKHYQRNTTNSEGFLHDPAREIGVLSSRDSCILNWRASGEQSADFLMIDEELVIVSCDSLHVAAPPPSPFPRCIRVTCRKQY